MTRTWNSKVKRVNVQREGDGSIDKITVSAMRDSNAYSGYACAEYEFMYEVNHSMTANLREIEADTVRMHHVTALLAVVESAVSNIPDVDAVHRMENSIYMGRENVEDIND